MSCRRSTKSLRTRLLPSGSKPLCIRRCLVIQLMLPTIRRSWPDYWSGDVGKSSTAAKEQHGQVNVNFPALSLSSASYCAVRTPETEVSRPLVSTWQGKHVRHVNGLVSGSWFCAPAVANCWPTLTARQFDLSRQGIP